MVCGEHPLKGHILLPAPFLDNFPFSCNLRLSYTQTELKSFLTKMFSVPKKLLSMLYFAHRQDARRFYFLSL